MHVRINLHNVSQHALSYGPMTSHPRAAQIPLILHPFCHATPWRVASPPSILHIGDIPGCVWPMDCPLSHLRWFPCASSVVTPAPVPRLQLVRKEAHGIHIGRFTDAGDGPSGAYYGRRGWALRGMFLVLGTYGQVFFFVLGTYG